MDYLECSACYRVSKLGKRRYKRATAQRHLDRVLERVKQLASEPMRCHWIPDAAILFGSMLGDAVRVGDVDLCVLGDNTHRKRIETFQEMFNWAAANSPHREAEYFPSYPGRAAYRFIRQRDFLVNLTLEQDFADVGGGRPFPYRVIWTATGIEAQALCATIDAQRPQRFAESVKGRQANVERVLKKSATAS